MANFDSHCRCLFTIEITELNADELMALRDALHMALYAIPKKEWPDVIEDLVDECDTLIDTLNT